MIYTILYVCLFLSQKNFIACPYYDARFQTNSNNCLSYCTNNLANNGFAMFSKTGIIIYNMSNIEHFLRFYNYIIELDKEIKLRKMPSSTFVCNFYSVILTLVLEET